MADAHDDKSIRIVRMIWVCYHSGVGISKDSLGFFKGNLMLGYVHQVLLFVPFESYVSHNYIIIILTICQDRSRLLPVLVYSLTLSQKSFCLFQSACLFGELKAL